MSLSPKQFDQVDQDILSLLHIDGRMTNKDIAAKLEVSEGTIRNRIKKLTESGAVKIAGLVNPDFFPDRNLVQLGVTVAASRELNTVAGKIAALPNVTSVYIITGKTDILIEAFVDSKFGVIEFIDDQLSTIDGVVSTETHVVIKHYNKWLDLDIS